MCNRRVPLERPKAFVGECPCMKTEASTKSESKIPVSRIPQPVGNFWKPTFSE